MTLRAKTAFHEQIHASHFQNEKDEAQQLRVSFKVMDSRVAGGSIWGSEPLIQGHPGSGHDTPKTQEKPQEMIFNLPRQFAIATVQSEKDKYFEEAGTIEKSVSFLTLAN